MAATALVKWLCACVSTSQAVGLAVGWCMCTPCFKFVVACAFLAYYYATAACSLVKKFRPVAITFNLNFYYMAETISKPDKANPSFVATQAGKKGPSCPLGWSRRKKFSFWLFILASFFCWVFVDRDVIYKAGRLPKMDT